MPHHHAPPPFFKVACPCKADWKLKCSIYAIASALHIICWPLLAGKSWKWKVMMLQVLIRS